MRGRRAYRCATKAWSVVEIEHILSIYPSGSTHMWITLLTFMRLLSCIVILKKYLLSIFHTQTCGLFAMFYSIQPADVVLLLLSLSPLDTITSVLVNLVQKISLLVYICSQKHGWNAQPVARSNPRPMQTRSNERHSKIVYLSRLGVKVNFWSPRICIHTAPNVEILIPLDIMQLSSSTYRWTRINCSSITSVEKEEEQRRRVLLVAGKGPREGG